MDDFLLNRQPKYSFERLINELKANRYWLCYLILIAVIGFAYELFNFSLTIDEELYAGMKHASEAVGWVQQGRWGMYLLSFLFPVNPIIPFVPMFLTLVFSALSFAIVVKIILPHVGLERYFAAPLFIVCPVLYYSYSFNTLNYGLGIGFFTGALALFVFLYADGGLRKWLISPLLMVMASHPYNSDEYIRDYTDFLKQVK